MRNLKLMVATFALALVLVSSVTAAIVVQYRYSIGASATVQGYDLAVYEVGGTTPVTQISFGNVKRGTSTFHDIIVENIGDYDANLGLECDLGAVYGSVGWNYSGAVLYIGQSIPLRITLTLKPDCPRGALTFGINITCWEIG